MIVTCERCATQFQLDDARVPARGVRVRCSRCKYAFRVVPAAQRTAEEVAALARRAREDGEEEITQDMAEDSAGDSLSRAGVRRERRAESRPAPSAPAEEGGLLDEESDWKFNEDVAERDPRGSTAAGRELKPDPPEAAPPARSSGRLGDDWFHGGSDAPLELDDRPRNASGVPEDPPVEEPAPAPVLAPAPVPAALAAPAPLARSVTPQALPVASLEATEASTAGDDFEAGLDALDPSGVLAKAPAEGSGTDELSGDGFDLLAAAEEAEAEQAVQAPETQEPPAERASERRLGGELLLRLLRWLGYGAHGIGWAATGALFAAGLYIGLAPVSQPAPAVERVAGLELAGLEARFVENASAGALYVVSGRVRNPGPDVASLRPLELELIDAEGIPLAGARAALHAPSPSARLREAAAAELSALPPLHGAIRAGEERSFEAVIAGLPAGAVAWRIVEGERRAAAAPAAAEPLPQVDLPSASAQ